MTKLSLFLLVAECKVQTDSGEKISLQDIIQKRYQGIIDFAEKYLPLFEAALREIGKRPGTICESQLFSLFSSVDLYSQLRTLRDAFYAVLQCVRSYSFDSRVIAYKNGQIRLSDK